MRFGSPNTKLSGTRLVYKGKNSKDYIIVGSSLRHMLQYSHIHKQGTFLYPKRQKSSR